MADARSRRGTSPGGGGRSAPRRRAAARPAAAGGRGAADARQGRRRTRRPARSTSTTGRSPLVTGRAVLLGVLVLLLALTLAGPVRSFVAGRQELAELAAENQALSLQEQQLQAELDRQGDPAYLAQQARQRLNFVLPGDRLVIVADGTVVAGEEPARTPGIAEDAPQVPWYEGLLQSVGTADGG
ncbi:FtsB family cell division protein [Klenkia terrae]|uniref:Septum formation initiator family protein n=1 Tax=Klenkia terrae TaxID=1052259 RepID=A0ABU8E0J0_9ACTN|nr:septum formation initiator family protein [Klenkia terrae]